MTEENKEPEVKEEVKKKFVLSVEDKTIEKEHAGRKKHLRIREVKIKFNDKEEFVHIKKMGFGQKEAYQASFIDIKSKGEEIDTNININNMGVNALKETIIKAPFPMEEDYYIEEMDPTLGNELMEEVDDFNDLNEKKKLI